MGSIELQGMPRGVRNMLAMFTAGCLPVGTADSIRNVHM
jgi:hypothetical protein